MCTCELELSTKISVCWYRIRSGLDRERCILIALAHDMIEFVIRDITSHDDVTKDMLSLERTDAKNNT